MPPVPQVTNSYVIAPAGTGAASYRDDCPSPAMSIGPQEIDWPASAYEIFGPQTYTINLTNIVGQQRLKGVQTAYIDNSKCAFGVTLTDCAGNSQDVPAGWQAFLAVQYIGGAAMTLKPVTGAGVTVAVMQASPNTFGDATKNPLRTIIDFFNYQVTPRIWKGESNPAPMAIGGNGGLYPAPALDEFGQFTDQFTAQFSSGAIGVANFMTPNYLSNVQWQSFAARLMVGGTIEFSELDAILTDFRPVVDIWSSFAVGTNLGGSPQVTICPLGTGVSFPLGSGGALQLPATACNLWNGDAAYGGGDGPTTEHVGIICRVRNMGLQVPAGGVTVNMSFQGILT